MESWQVIYLVIVGAGFGVGWLTSPIVAVVFVWVAIVTAEIINYRSELREFERKSEESTPSER